MDSNFLDEYVHGRRSVQEYVEYLLAQARLSELRDGTPELYDALRSHLLSGVLELDALPRDHAFWQNTNLRPTVSKMLSFYQEKWENAAEPSLIWKRLSVALVAGDYDGVLQDAERLARSGAVSLEWLVHLVAHLIIVRGHGDGELLIDLMNRLGAKDLARNALQRLEGHPSAAVVERAQRLRAALT